MSGESETFLYHRGILEEILSTLLLTPETLAIKRIMTSLAPNNAQASFRSIRSNSTSNNHDRVSQSLCGCRLKRGPGFSECKRGRL